VPEPELTTRHATSDDVDVLQRLTAAGARRIDAMVLESNRPARERWSPAGYTRQSNWARWIKPIARRMSGA
jgi:hypothetical protein